MSSQDVRAEDSGPVEGVAVTHALRADAPEGRPGRLPAWRSWGTTEQWITLVIGAFLIWEIVIPLVALVFSSLKEARPSDADYYSLQLTLQNYREALSSPRLWSVMTATLIFAVGSSLLALLMGAAAAIITTRTNAVFRGLIASAILYQLAMPEIMYPVVWQFLLSPDLGLINQWWMSLTNSETALFNVYSLPGMIWVESMLLLPLVYIFMVPAVSAMDRSLEEAAEVCGASRLKVMTDVVLPLSLPAMVATLVIALMRAWEAFEVPWYLGIPEGIQTFSTFLYFSTITPPSDTGLISSFALPMLVIALAMVWWYDRFNRAAARYSVITGKSYRSEPMSLSTVSRWVIGTVGLVVVVLGVLVPALMLVWLSINRFYRPPSLAALGTLSFDSYAEVFTRPQILDGFRNSLIVGVGSTLLILLVTALSTWIVAHARDTRGRGLLNLLTFVPMAYPNIVVGICLLWLYLSLPVNIRGTHLALILGYFILFVAIAARNIGARVLQVNVELHEAAAVSGAGFLTSFRTIIVPALAPALLASGLYVVAWAFKELETTLLLSSPSTQTASVVMFDLSRVSTIALTSAVGVVTGVALIGVVALFQLFARRAGIPGF